MLLRSALFLATLSLAACSVPVPAPGTDTEPPTVFLSIVDPSGSGSEIVARSDETLVTADCPPGTNRAGQPSGAHITDVTNSPVRFALTLSDGGGVGSVLIEVLNNDVVSDVEVAPSSVTPTVGPGAGGRTLISADFAQSMSGQILSFTVTSPDDRIVLDALGTDQSGNSIQLVDGATRRFQVNDLSTCD